jgi:hypothetical protein
VWNKLGWSKLVGVEKLFVRVIQINCTRYNKLVERVRLIECTCVRILTPNAHGLRTNEKQLERTAWIWSSAHMPLNYVCYSIFVYIHVNFCQSLFVFTRRGDYKVTPDNIDLSKTLAPCPEYEHNTLCYK